MPQSDMFPSSRRPEAEAELQVRMLRDQLLSDRAFAIEICRAVYEAGPDGMPMRELINTGIERKWWQDTVQKHFGEKMRCAWAYGLIVVPDRPGDQTTSGKRIVHPAHFDIQFQSDRLRRSWELLKSALKWLDFHKQNKMDTDQ